MKIEMKNCYELLIETELSLISRGFKLEPTILLHCKCGKINYFGEPICYGCGKLLR